MDNLYNQVNTFNNFNPGRLEETEEGYIKGFPYLFLTTPFLNFSEENIKSNTFLSYMYEFEPDVLKQLSYGSGAINSPSPFIKILSNRFKSMESRDTTARTKQINETFYGHKQIVPGTYLDSINGDQFTITYAETSKLHIVKLHKIWLEYVENLRRGLYHPSQSAKDFRYIDFYSSLYYFIVDFDGETIKFFSKYTGISPINIPYNVFSMAIPETPNPVELNVNYVYCYKEDMDPATLFDFNYVSKHTSSLVSSGVLNGNTEEIKTQLQNVNMVTGKDQGINSQLLNKDGKKSYYDGNGNIHDWHESLTNKTSAEVVYSDKGDGEYTFKLKFY